MTASFPEIVEAFAGVQEPLVLDGEILAWRHGSISEEGRALPFSSLQARLGRKRVTAEMRESVPVVFMAFDVLYAAGEMTMERPLKERRRVLEGLVEREQALTRVGSRLNSTAQQRELLFETAARTTASPGWYLPPRCSWKAWPSSNRHTWMPGRGERRRDAEGPA